MEKYDRILLSGASGAVGPVILADLLRRYPRAEVACVVRSEKSLQRLRGVLSVADFARVQPIHLDLAAPAAQHDSIENLRQAQRSVVVHCAADVSWTKPERFMEPINVHGTRRLAQLAIATSRDRPAFVFLSTAFIEEGAEFRNAYEKTKLAAEHLLQLEFAAYLDLAIVRCSLIVGSSQDGAIPKFNGLYPVIRLVALAEVPCVIADASYHVDTVPVDYVAAQVAEAAAALCEERRFLQLVAASGKAAISIRSLVERTLVTVNHYRAEAELPPLPQISVLSNRQFQFLMRAAKSWDMAERFDQLDRINGLMSGYVVHGESGRSIQPYGLGSPLAPPESYLDKVIRYWLVRNSERVLVDRRWTWQVGTQNRDYDVSR